MEQIKVDQEVLNILQDKLKGFNLELPEQLRWVKIERLDNMFEVVLADKKEVSIDSLGLFKNFMTSCNITVKIETETARECYRLRIVLQYEDFQKGGNGQGITYFIENNKIQNIY